MVLQRRPGEALDAMGPRDHHQHARRVDGSQRGDVDGKWFVLHPGQWVIVRHDRRPGTLGRTEEPLSRLDVGGGEPSLLLV